MTYEIYYHCIFVKSVFVSHYNNITILLKLKNIDVNEQTVICGKTTLSPQADANTDKTEKHFFY